MEKKPFMTHMYTWISEDFPEFWKLIRLSLGRTSNNVVSISKNNNEVNCFEVVPECENCYRTFDFNQFENYVCDFADPKTMIYDDAKMNLIWYHGPLVRMYAENNAKIQEFLNRFPEVRAFLGLGKKPPNQSNHRCNLCSRSYVHESGLQRHKEAQHNLNVLLPLKNDYRSNIQENNNAEMVKCLICGQIFNSSESCFLHIKSSHPQYNFDETKISLNIGEALLFAKLKVDHAFQCEFCDLLFADTPNLFDHKMEHDTCTGFECNFCQLTSRNLNFILNHRNSKCPYKKRAILPWKIQFACSDCGRAFDSLVLLYEHRYLEKHFPSLHNRLLNKNEFFCEKCGQTCGTEANNLIVHIENAHSQKRKTQDLSDSTLSRPFLCEICGKRYTQSSHLYQHLRFHKGIKPFECSEAGCNRKFTIRPDLNDHIRKCHTRERPYKCSDCNKTFLTGSVYYQHRLIHRNERRYGCGTCGKRFHRSDALKNHERIHSGEKPYACSGCSKTFRQKGDRDKHFRSRHQNISKPVMRV